MTLSCCGKDIINEEDAPARSIHYNPDIQTKQYLLCLSFVTDDGKDLVASMKQTEPGIINPGQYSLSIILPDGRYDNSCSFTVSNLGGKFIDRCLLFSDFSYSAQDSVELFESLQYRITCPIIFGDNSAHTISTNWSDNNEWAECPQCISAYYDDKEVNVKQITIDHTLSRDLYGYFIEVIIGR